MGKTRCGVVKKNNPEQVIDVDIITTIKFVDLDACIHYHEIRFLDGTKDEHLFDDDGYNVATKRNIDEVVADVVAEHDDDDDDDDDPILIDDLDIEFTDLVKTEEMEGFLKLLGGGGEQQKMGAFRMLFLFLVEISFFSFL